MTAVLPRASVARRQRVAPRVPVSAVERGVVQALAYSDVFDWPLTPAEIHRYLPVRATLAEVEVALKAATRNGAIERAGDLAVLRGRTAISGVRRKRSTAAAALWPHALRWAKVAGRLPFVRMVAVTGSLAAGSAGDSDDVDLLIVTEPGRLWLTRAMTMLLVRAAAVRGLRLCPNFFLDDGALRLPDRSVFAAREIVQMIPVADDGTYARFIAENGWYREFLPNAEPPRPAPARNQSHWLRRLAEAVLRARPFDRLERWEMRRKVRLLRAASRSSETQYDEHRCKGHADEHGRRVLAAYEARIRRLSEVM